MTAFVDLQLLGLSKLSNLLTGELARLQDGRLIMPLSSGTDPLMLSFEKPRPGIYEMRGDQLCFKLANWRVEADPASIKPFPGSVGVSTTSLIFDSSSQPLWRAPYSWQPSAMYFYDLAGQSVASAGSAFAAASSWRIMAVEGGELREVYVQEG